MEDVRPDDLVRAEREDDEQREPEEDAASDRRQPDDEAAEEPDQDGGDAVAVRQLPVGIPGGTTRLDEALRDQPDCAEEQRGTEHLPHHRLRLVAVALGELHVEPDAERGTRAPSR